MTENETGAPGTGTPASQTGDAGLTDSQYSLSGPYAVKIALEGSPFRDVSRIEDPWRTWASHISQRRNGRTAADIWEDILAGLPALQQSTVRAAVLSATPDPEQWVSRINEAFATSPYRRSAEKARQVFVEALQMEDPAFNIEKLLSPLTMVDATDILAKPHPDPVYAVPGLIPAGLSMLGGRPKVGKSWLSMQIALAVATGGVTLGQRVEMGRVLYLALEDSERRLQERMRAQGWQGTRPGQVQFILAESFRNEIQFLNAGGSARLIKHLEKERFRLVIIDTFSRAFKGDQNDSEAMTGAVGLLQNAVNRLEIACIIVDHHTKPKGADPNPVDDILGSSAKAAVPDTLIGLYKEQGKSGARLAIRSRVVEERTLQLRWDKELCCWQSEGDADKYEASQHRHDALTALANLGPSQVGPLAEQLGCNKGQVHKQLQALVASGEIVRSGSGRQVVYRLPGQAEPEEAK
jgi:RecA-family ATPase